MKFKLFLAAGACALSFLSAGCYTEFATHEPSDRGYDDDEYVTSSSDTTDNGAADNQYFGDDSYRHSRFQVAFGYYYPWRWGYYVPVYDPWFDDPWYWSDGWRPYVLWPYPTWYPYYGYYGHHHYWGYYSDPWYYGGGYYGHDGGGSGAPHRTRLMGPTREASGTGIRQRSPIATPTLGTVGGGTQPTGIRTRGGSDEQRGGVAAPTTRTRGGDTPWWERTGRDDRGAQQSRRPSGQEVRTERRPRQVEQAPGSATPSRPTQSQGTTTTRPRTERRERPQSSGQSDSRPQSQPRYSPPANNGGGGGGRERSSGGSAPSGRTSSGGSSSNGGSRTRSGR